MHLSCRFERREPSLEEPPLPLGPHECQGEEVRLARLLLTAEPPQQLGSSRVQVVVVVELELVDDREARERAVGLGDRDGSVQLYHGRPRQTGKLGVEQRNLPPIYGRGRMESPSRRLDDVAATAAQGER